MRAYPEESIGQPGIGLTQQELTLAIGAGQGYGERRISARSLAIGIVSGGIAPQGSDGFGGGRKASCRTEISLIGTATCPAPDDSYYRSLGGVDAGFGFG